MKCSKPRFAFRPQVENLESRLQPGSILTNSGYGASLVADHLSILNSEAVDSQSLVAQSPSESSNPTAVSAPADTHSTHLAITVAPVATTRSSGPSTPSDTPVNNLAAVLMPNDLFSQSSTGNAHPLPVAAAVISTAGTHAHETPGGSVAHSPVGVSTPAAPVQSASSARAVPQAVTEPAPTAQKVDAQAVASSAPLQPGPSFHTTTVSIPNQQINPAVIQGWASYLGSAGEGRLLAVAYDPTGNAQPVVVGGFTTSGSDSSDVAGVVARFSGDGKSATLFSLDMGSNTHTEVHGVAVDPNSGAIYATGVVITQNGNSTLDFIDRINASLTNVDWTYSHTAAAIAAVGNGLSVDSTGTNLYATGTLDGNTYVTKLTNLGPGGPTVVYDQSVTFPAGTSAGNAVAPDSAGNADLAVAVQNGSDTIAGEAQLSANGTAVNWANGFASPGPTGSMNAVTVDSSDNVYVTGGFVGHWAGNAMPFLSIITASFDNMGNQLGGIQVYYFSDSARTIPGQGVGYGLFINPANNNVYVGITDSGFDPVLGLQGNIDFLVFDPGLTKIVADEGGDVYGALDDQNRGIALDTSRPAIYQAGFTNSTDFLDTTGEFQPTHGGGTYDGIAIGYIST